MTTRHRKGTTFVLVLATLTLLAGMMVVMGEISRTMLFESRRSYLEAATHNLQASAAGWLRCNPSAEGSVSLDIKDMRIADGSLEVIIPGRAGGAAPVLVSTECRSGRMIIRRSCSQPVK